MDKSNVYWGYTTKCVICRKEYDRNHVKRTFMSSDCFYRAIKLKNMQTEEYDCPYCGKKTVQHIISFDS